MKIDLKKSKQIDRTKILHVCYNCSQKKICVACHCKAPSSCLVFVCQNHYDAYKGCCPICNQRGGAGSGHAARYCQKCFWKYKRNCFKCS